MEHFLSQSHALPCKSSDPGIPRAGRVKSVSYELLQGPASSLLQSTGSRSENLHIYIYRTLACCSAQVMKNKLFVFLKADFYQSVGLLSPTNTVAYAGTTLSNTITLIIIIIIMRMIPPPLPPPPPGPMCPQGQQVHSPV